MYGLCLRLYCSYLVCLCFVIAFCFAMYCCCLFIDLVCAVCDCLRHGLFGLLFINCLVCLLFCLWCVFLVCLLFICFVCCWLLASSFVFCFDWFCLWLVVIDCIWLLCCVWLIVFCDFGDSCLALVCWLLVWYCLVSVPVAFVCGFA